SVDAILARVNALYRRSEIVKLHKAAISARIGEMELAEKYPMPPKYELALEEGNGETAKRLLMKQGYIAQTLPQKPKSPLQRYRLLRKGKDVLV
ncbi:MAG: hypothetical protein IKA69_02570, partial [Kiritimatiellae bacterium]|nr:hypothetical protein [Kiritimatiellia bacterium]